MLSTHALLHYSRQCKGMFNGSDGCLWSFFPSFGKEKKWIGLKELCDTSSLQHTFAKIQNDWAHIAMYWLGTEVKKNLCNQVNGDSSRRKLTIFMPQMEKRFLRYRMHSQVLIKPHCRRKKGGKNRMCASSRKNKVAQVFFFFFEATTKTWSWIPFFSFLPLLNIKLSDGLFEC